MPTVNDTKVTFVGVDADQKKGFKQQHAVLLISLWQKDPKKLDAFRATLHLAEQYFEKITILVADSLQQHNIKWQSNEFSEYAKQIAKKMGDDWIIENLPSINDLTISYKIKRWDDFLNLPSFDENYKSVVDAIAKSPSLKSTFLKDERDYIKRIENDNFSISDNDFKSGMDYLLEEAYIFLMMEKSNDYDVILYPNPSLDFFYPLLKHFSPKYKLKWIQFNIETKNRHSRIGAIERTIKEPIDLYFQILSLLPSHFYWIDKNNKYLGCSGLQAKAFGLNSNLDIIGRSNSHFFNAEEAERLDTINLNVMRDRKSHELEETVHFQGEFKTFISKKIPLYSEKNEVIGLLGISMDITDRKQLENDLRKAKEKAEVANRAKSEFVANMSHDIRTPITGMVGMIHDIMTVCDQFKTMKEKSLDVSKEYDPVFLKMIETIDTIAEDSNILMGATDELLQFFNEVLEVVRLESNQMDYHASSFNLRELVSHNCEMLQSVARHKKIELTSHIDANVPIFMTGYRMYLDRVILNLLSNALKFTAIGSVGIIISLEDKNKSHENIGDSVTINIAVKDTGIGIQKDKFEFIFENFSRLSPSYDGLYTGSGMGLYTVQRYIEAMKGKIMLESVVGEGSCFTVTAPFVIAGHADHIKQSIRSHKPSKSAQLLSKKIESKISDNVSSQNNKAHILIVEDAQIASLTLKKFLNQLHCTSDIADTGTKAVSMANANTYDLIFMDIGLPDSDGVEVTKRIRALSDSKKSQVPIIAVTGHGNDPGIRARALDAGMQEVTSKPTNIPTLAEYLDFFIFEKKEKQLKEDCHKNIIDWEGMSLRYPDNQDFINEIIQMSVVEVNTGKSVMTESFTNRDSILLRHASHRIRGAISYVILPQLEKALEIFHQSINDNWDNEQTLQKNFDALIKEMDIFLKAALK